MQRICLIIALTLASLAGLAGTASAASQTVQGTGDIDKMVVRNATKAVKVNLFGLGPPCEAHYMRVTVDWGTKAGYQVENGCYPGATWAHGLSYLPNRSKLDSAKMVECPGLRFVYSATTQAHRLRVPRSCIPKAANKLRVRSIGHDYGAMTEGKAGPTRMLRRG